MLSLTVFKSGSSAADVRGYLEIGVLKETEALEDYYLENGSAEAAFLGSALKRLGLTTTYSQAVFERLFQGKAPDGQPLTLQEGRPVTGTGQTSSSKTEDTRRPGWDLTFSAPKSVSVAWALADADLQKKIEAVHDRAVQHTFSYLERNVNTVSVGRGTRDAEGKIQVQKTRAKLVGTTFRHGTSREQDPDLHTHLLLFNIAERADGKLMSVNGADFYARKKELGAIYRVSLADGLKELGFSVKRDRFSFGIAGIDKTVQQHFSQRREQIEQSMAINGQTSARASDIAALATREPKVEKLPSELRAEWQERAKDYDFTTERITALTQAEKLPEPDSHDALSLDTLLEKITEFDSAVTDFKVREVLAVEAQTRLSVTETEALMARFFSQENTGLVPLHLEGKAYYSSHALQAVEKQLVETAQALHRTAHRTVKAKHVDKALNRFSRKHDFSLGEEQMHAVRHMTEHTGQIALIQGSAGTGKSTALEVARMAWQKRGLRVRGAALQGKAAAQLNAAGIESSTLAALLLKSQDFQNEHGETIPALDPLIASDVVVVDEAGQVDSRTLADLLNKVHAAGAKVVLVGDTKQLQAVAAGGAFHALQKHAALPVKALDRVHRQRTAVTRSVVANIAEKSPESALQTLLNTGRLHQVENASAAMQTAIERWSAQYQSTAFNKTILISNTNVEVARLNELARHWLLENNHLSTALSNAIEVTDRMGTSLGKKDFVEGERIIFRQNDKTLGIQNGELANITRITLGKNGGHDIEALKASGESVKFNTHDYDRFDYGYAITTHLSQGMTVDHAVVLIGEGVQNYHSSYVQVSRVKDDIDVVVTPSAEIQAMLSGPPTESMLAFAESLSAQKQLGESFDNKTFQEVRDFLNQHAYVIKEGTDNIPSELLALKDLIVAMKKEAIKKTTLDYAPAEATPVQTLETTTVTQPVKHISKPSVETKPYWDKDRVLDTLMTTPEFFVESIVDERKNTRLSRPGRLDVWGAKGSVRLITDPNHRHYGYISDFERGYNGNLIGYIAEMTGKNWHQVLGELAQEMGVEPERRTFNGVDPARLKAERAEKNREQEKRAEQESAKKIARVQKVWQETQPLAGTVAERYLREVRGIHGELRSDDVRFNPAAKDTVLDEHGQYKETVLRPALIVGARDANGKITAVQHIYLDPKTAQKHPDAQVAKRTQGVVSGSAVLMHKGSANTVIFAEGPETGSSLAVAHPEANIYVSLGNNRNFGHLAHVVKQHNTTEVVFAADNDGGKSTPSYKSLEKAAEQLRAEGITVRVAMPDLLPGKSKTDFNDVLQNAGIDAVKTQVARAVVMKDREREVSYER